MLPYQLVRWRNALSRIRYPGDAPAFVMLWIHIAHSCSTMFECPLKLIIARLWQVSGDCATAVNNLTVYPTHWRFIHTHYSSSSVLTYTSVSWVLFWIVILFICACINTWGRTHKHVAWCITLFGIIESISNPLDVIQSYTILFYRYMIVISSRYSYQ